jgi:hypothetical protein
MEREREKKFHTITNQQNFKNIKKIERERERFHVIDYYIKFKVSF